MLLDSCQTSYPGKTGRERDVEAVEKANVISADDTALRVHQVEENRNTRQLVGKTWFGQGKYDAALALFSLTAKLREDDALWLAKATSIADTDVDSGFIHMEDLKSASKHLNKPVAIFNNGTF